MIDAVELTQQLVRLDTVNPPGNEENLADLISDVLNDARFDIECVRFDTKRMNVVARRGKISECNQLAPLCFTGHLDTVPIGGSAWTQDPFGADIVDGRLYGRGSSDMKSGVAAMIAAAVETAETGVLDEGPGLMLVFTAGEETGCQGAQHLVNNVELEAAGALIVGEPTGNLPRCGHKGALWMRAESIGKTAHGSMPELGVNAIYRTLKLVSKLQDFGFNLPSHPGLGDPTLNIGLINGGMNVNSVPDHAEVSIDIRTIPGMAHSEYFNNFVRYLAPELEKLVPVVDLESIWTNPRDKWIQRILGHLEWSDKTDELSGVPFFTDASVLAPAMKNPPVLILGPGETAMAHQTDEYCEVSKIYQAVDIYRMLINDWQNSSVSDEASALVEMNENPASQPGFIS